MRYVIYDVHSLWKSLKKCLIFPFFLEFSKIQIISNETFLVIFKHCVSYYSTSNVFESW